MKPSAGQHKSSKKTATPDHNLKSNENAVNVKRKEYVEKLAIQLDEWNAEIALFKAKADKATAEAKIEYYEITKGLKEMHALAWTKLEEMKTASDEAWEEIKNGAEKAWSEVKNAFVNASSKFI